MILRCADRLSSKAVGAELGAHEHTVGKWRRRFLKDRLDGLYDAERGTTVAFGLQPHRSETFKLSTDPLFVDKVRDIVGLYWSPPDRALVLCVDEKSQIQALDREQPVLPMLNATVVPRSAGVPA